MKYYTVQYLIIGKTYSDGDKLPCINIGVDHKLFMTGYTFKQIEMMIELEAVKRLHDLYDRYKMFSIQSITEAPIHTIA